LAVSRSGTCARGALRRKHTLALGLADGRKTKQKVRSALRRVNRLRNSRLGSSARRQTKAACSVSLWRSSKNYIKCLPFHSLPVTEKFLRALDLVKVFARFGFGQRIEALLLSQIYPLQNYFANGEPEIKICNGRRCGKATKRYLSWRRFMKALGCAPSHSWQWRHQQVESQRWLKLMSKSFVAVDIYADRTQTATIGKRHRLSPWGNVGF